MKKLFFSLSFLALVLVAFLIMSFAKVTKTPPPNLFHPMFSGGITGVSIGGCTCHGASVTSGVNVFITGLPTSPVVGVAYPLLFNVQGSNPNAGFNLAVNSGTLASNEAEVQLLNSELTHTNPKSLVSNATTFAFTWTPTVAGNATFTYAGNNVNGSGTGGDFWNRGSLSVLSTEVTTPVTISSFNGININNNTNTIYWTAEREIDFEKYEIENSCDGILFNKIGNIIPTSSNALVKTYEFTHKNINCTSTKNFYRIKLINKDGSFAYTSIIAIAKNTKDIVPTLYPNPITIGTYKIMINVGNREVKELLLLNRTGSILNKYIGTSNVINDIALPTNMAKGNYFIKIYFKNNTEFTLPFLY